MNEAGCREGEAPAKPERARAKLDEGLAVFAGTINPHLPRQLIPHTAFLIGWPTSEMSSHPRLFAGDILPTR
jgi:hypothetical protein